MQPGVEGRVAIRPSQASPAVYVWPRQRAWSRPLIWDAPGYCRRPRYRLLVDQPNAEAPPTSPQQGVEALQACTACWGWTPRLKRALAIDLPRGRRAQRVTLRSLVNITPDKVLRQGLRHLKRPLRASSRYPGGRRTVSEHRRAQHKHVSFSSYMGRFLTPPEVSLGASPGKLSGGRQEKGALKYLSVGIRDHCFHQITITM